MRYPTSQHPSLPTSCPTSCPNTSADADPADEDGNRWIAELTDELIHTAGSMNTLEARFIELVSEYDDYELWRVGSTGIKNFANWLNVYCGLHPLVAREKIRVARRLRNLPEIKAAFGADSLSYSKVRALTRAATPDNESLLLEDARAMTAAQLEQRVRRFKKVADVDPYASEEDQEGNTEPWVKCWRDDDGCFHLHARLAAEDGALVENAIERMVNTGGSDEPDLLPAGYVQEEVEQEDGEQINREQASTKVCGAKGRNVSAGNFSRGAVNENATADYFGGRRAQALVNIAEHFLATAKDGAQTLKGGDKNHVVVHVNNNAAHRDCRINQGACTFMDKGEFLAPEVASRLACDASVTTVLEDDDGNVLNIDRRSRTVTRAIDLAVDIRDDFTCQHPWCHQRRHTQKHHIEHWATGGETSARNLVTLCQRHHTLAHEGVFKINVIDEGETYRFEFLDRAGEVISPVPDGPSHAPDPTDEEITKGARQEPVPTAQLDTSEIIDRKLSPDERRIERNYRQLAALRKLYGVREPQPTYAASAMRVRSWKINGKLTRLVPCP